MSQSEKERDLLSILQSQLALRGLAISQISCSNPEIPRGRLMPSSRNPSPAMTRRSSAALLSLPASVVTGALETTVAPSVPPTPTIISSCNEETVQTTLEVPLLRDDASGYSGSWVTESDRSPRSTEGNSGRDEYQPLKMDLWLRRITPATGQEFETGNEQSKLNDQTETKMEFKYKDEESESIMEDFNRRYSGPLSEDETRWLIREIARHLSDQKQFADFQEYGIISYRWPDFIIEEESISFPKSLPDIKDNCQEQDPNISLIWYPLTDGNGGGPLERVDTGRYVIQEIPRKDGEVIGYRIDNEGRR